MRQDIDALPADKRRQFQAQLWEKSVRRTWEKSAFYREKFDRAGLSLPDTVDLGNLSRLPFTTAEELRAAAPLDFLTGPLSTTIRLRRCAGALRAFTAGDVGRAAERTARALAAGDVNLASMLLLCGGADEQSAAIQYAGEVLGATVVPDVRAADAPGLMQQLGADFVAGSADELSALLRRAPALCRAQSLSGVFFWETTPKSAAALLAKAPAAPLLELFCPPALGCASALYACGEGEGLHVCEEDFCAEIVESELVLTSLTLEAMPFVRYRTGLRARILAEPCPCGRTTLRLARAD